MANRQLLGVRTSAWAALTLGAAGDGEGHVWAVHVRIVGTIVRGVHVVVRVRRPRSTSSTMTARLSRPHVVPYSASSDPAIKAHLDERLQMTPPGSSHCGVVSGVSGFPSSGSDRRLASGAPQHMSCR